MSVMTKEEFIYNKSIADMGIYLVLNKILPNELALYHYDIEVNIETVDMDNDDEVLKASKLLEETYKKLKNHHKFRNKVMFETNKIKLLEG